MPNRFSPIQPGTDPSQQAAIINNNFAKLDNENVKKLFYDVNGNPSIFIGVDQTGKSVIKVAKTGNDVTVATDSQLAFNSSQDVLKVVKTDTITVAADTFPATGATYAVHQTFTTINHGLSFVPHVIASILAGSTYTPLPAKSVVVNNGGLGGFIRWDVSAYSDLTNVTFQIDSFGANTTASTYGPLTIKYYLLQESAN